VSWSSLINSSSLTWVVLSTHVKPPSMSLILLPDLPFMATCIIIAHCLFESSQHHILLGSLLRLNQSCHSQVIHGWKGLKGLHHKVPIFLPAGSPSTLYWTATSMYNKAFWVLVLLHHTHTHMSRSIFALIHTKVDVSTNI
jgi:hypothetical protein